MGQVVSVGSQIRSADIDMKTCERCQRPMSYTRSLICSTCEQWIEDQLRADAKNRALFELADELHREARKARKVRKVRKA